ncbi:DUF4118 domain-containing protein [Bradyrhizobium frederickii]|uniref:DUF4118 domain-containing protein n=1 Tax=Bradyrhizobium frederickii TaxID=2560054 RepID=A0A4Y9KNE2_9BRAD|nr:DUF4118 domain-containing protein [Bradyrhizobium frederickii]TFV28190.1 DUF4118 domain-containing protein [Bradyrhizobium frederickii]
MILVDLGLELAFAAFFPAVLVSGFLGGKPAGAFAAVVTLPLVWWAFLPPAFEFSPLGAAACEDIKLFFLGSVLLVYFADLCRDLGSLDSHSYADDGAANPMVAFGAARLSAAATPAATSEDVFRAFKLTI